VDEQRRRGQRARAAGGLARAGGASGERLQTRAGERRRPGRARARMQADAERARAALGRRPRERRLAALAAAGARQRALVAAWAAGGPSGWGRGTLGERPRRGNASAEAGPAVRRRGRPRRAGAGRGTRAGAGGERGPARRLASGDGSAWIWARASAARCGPRRSGRSSVHGRAVHGGVPERADGCGARATA
jgi:hypothetical protein